MSRRPHATRADELGPEAVRYLATPVLPQPIDSDPLTAARARVEAESARFGGDPFPVRSAVDRTVAGVRVRDYEDVTVGEPHGLLIYLHGGGFVAGSIDSVDSVCRRLAVRTGWRIRSVDYRLAPEHPFPAGLEDTEAVLRAGLADARALDGPPRIAIGGESAGANLAAAAVLRVGVAEWTPHLVGQLLIYPLLARREDGASHRQFGDRLNLTLERLARYWDWYLCGASAEDTSVAPLLAPAPVAPDRTLVVVAGCDPLRSDGEDYVDLLRRNGATVELLHVPGVLHGFYRLAGAFPVALDVDQAVARWLA